MRRQILVTSGSVTAVAELNDTKTADAIWQALPFSNDANVWGDEIYFTIPTRIDLENGQEVVSLGDLGYWPPGSAFCVFFGATPVSREGEIRAASAVNVFGKIIDDPRVFKGVKQGERIVVARI